MLKRFAVTILFFSMLFCSSCKKSNFSNSKLENSKKKTWGNIFTDVSEYEAKKLVGQKIEKKSKNRLLTRQRLKNLRDIFCEKEAKLSDIPIPLNVESIDDFLDGSYSGNEIILGYRVSLSVDDILSFYKQEMERLGWQNMEIFDGYEKILLLNFKKPTKFCSVLINKCPCKNKSQDYCTITIFTKKQV